MNLLDLLRRLWHRPLGGPDDPPQLPRLPRDTRELDHARQVAELVTKHYPRGGPWWGAPS